MKKTIFAIALFSLILTSGAHAQQNGWVSRYWDGCKPSCSWQNSSFGNAKNCNRNNEEIPVNNSGQGNDSRSSCDGGNAYTCWDQIPFKDPNDPNVAYGFAATPSHTCGQCFELTFTGQGEHGTGPTHQALSGKKLIVMGSNIGGDVQGGQFDVLIPGGGVGQFDSFSAQIGVNNSMLGAQYGGLLTACTNGDNSAALATAQSCLRNKCNEVFGNKPAQSLLLEGCLFYADWFMAANNPKVSYRTVDCPKVLSDRYKTGSGGSTPTPGGNTNPPDTDTTKPPVVPPVTPPVASGDTIKVEAESYTSKNGDFRTENENGITVIGYIENGHSATYALTVDSASAGQRTVVFRIALNAADVPNGSFDVAVNGSQAGTISSNGTGGWSTFQFVTLSSKVQLKEGGNTITLNFKSAMNVDYFLLIGETPPPPISVRYNAARVAKARSQVTLKAVPRGFAATLPANHGYTSYSLVDLQGREIRKGKIAEGATDLKFNNLGNKAMFLRLEGKNNVSTVLKAMTF
jgi:hypothetical protein